VWKRLLGINIFRVLVPIWNVVNIAIPNALPPHALVGRGGRASLLISSSWLIIMAIDYSYYYYYYHSGFSAAPALSLF